MIKKLENLLETRSVSFVRTYMHFMIQSKGKKRGELNLRLLFRAFHFKLFIIYAVIYEYTSFHRAHSLLFPCPQVPVHLFAIQTRCCWENESVSFPVDLPGPRSVWYCDTRQSSTELVTANAITALNRLWFLYWPQRNANPTAISQPTIHPTIIYSN